MAIRNGSRRPAAQAAAALIVVALWLLQPALAAQANAILIGASPAAGARLYQAAAQIELSFSEPVEPDFSAIVVRDAGQNRRDADDLQVDPLDPTRLMVSLRALPTGAYTVTWRAMSSVDGRVASGAYAFTVGPVTGDALSPEPVAWEPQGPTFLDVLARVLRDLGLTILFGGSVAVWWLLPEERRAAWKRRLTWGWAFFWPGQILYACVLAGAAAGGPPVFLWEQAAQRWLIEGQPGLLWLLQTWLGLAVLLMMRWDANGRLSGVVALWAAALGAALWGAGSTGIASATSILHGWAASIGIAALVVWSVETDGRRSPGSYSAGHRPYDAYLDTTARPLLAGAATALLLTGGVRLWQSLGEIQALWSSAYGGLLLAKIALTTAGFGLVGLATHTALHGPGFRRNASMALSLVALVLAGWMASLPTPASVATQPIRTTESVRDRESGGLSSALSVLPSRAGRNTLSLVLGPESAATNGITVRLQSMDGQTDPRIISLTAVGTNVYQSQVDLTVGRWRVEIVGGIDAGEPALASYDLAVREAVSPPIEAPFSTHQLSALLIVLIAPLLGLAVDQAWQALKIEHIFRAGRRNWGGRWLGLSASVSLVLWIVAWMSQPRPVEAFELANPTPRTADSAEAGRAVYLTVCADCHGLEGRGDGPLGLTLNPRPVDLRIHAQEGVHSDGTLFLWITQGIPGTTMPAYANELSPQDRWHLVNYMRALAGAPTVPGNEP